MATQVSPGVVINEVDRSDSLTQVALTEAAVAGPFTWGPIEKAQTVSSEREFVERFGKPNNASANAFFTGANFLSYSNTLRVVRAANTDTTNATACALNATEDGGGLLVKNDDHYELTIKNSAPGEGVWGAKYAGVLGNSLRVEMCPSANAFSSNGLGTASFSGTTVVFSSNNFAVVSVGDTLIVGTQKRRVTGVQANGTHVTVASQFVNIANGASFSREWRYAGLFRSAPGTSTFASNLGAADDELHVVVVDEDGVITGTPNSVLEKFEALSKAVDGRAENGQLVYYPELINAQSQWVWWLEHPATNASNWGDETTSGTTFDGAATPSAASLSGGQAGAGVSQADIQRAYDVFLDEQIEYSFLLGADANANVASYLVDSVAAPRKYVMTFLSPEFEDVVNNVGNEASDVVAFRNAINISSSYAVLDSGWKYQYDKYNQVYRYIPLNGDVAGLAARSDQTSESWFSPAGFTRGQLRVGNTVKLAYNPSQSDRDTLYLKGINPVVAFPGQGTVLFGDKTLQSKPSAFDRINVRRLFIVLEKTIERSAKSLLFEQNDEFTRNQFINIVEPFLRSVKGRRGISDYYIVCDATNNPQDAVDRNEFRADIYVKPVRSINFIQLNFVAVRSDVSFNEVITNLS